MDTKILSKFLAKRISKVIGKLINCQQTAFIKGRYIGEGIRLISNIMFYTEKENIEGMILALDLTVMSRGIRTQVQSFQFRFEV